MPAAGGSAPACWMRSAGILIDLGTLLANDDGRSAVSLNGCQELEADVPPFVGPGLMRVGGCGHAAAPC